MVNGDHEAPTFPCGSFL